MKNPANTHSIRHAGPLLSRCGEGGLPPEVTADLDTVGPYDYDGRVDGMMRR